MFESNKLIVFIWFYFIFTIIFWIVYIIFVPNPWINIYSIFFWSILDIVIFFVLYFLYLKIIYNIKDNFNKKINKFNFLIIILIFISIIIISLITNYIPNVPNIYNFKNIINFNLIGCLSFFNGLMYAIYLTIMLYIALSIFYNQVKYINYLTKENNFSIEYYEKNIKYTSTIWIYIVMLAIGIILIIDYYPLIHNILIHKIHLNNINAILLYIMKNSNIYKLIITVFIYVLILFIFVIYPFKIIKINFLMWIRKKYINYLIEKEKEFFENKKIDYEFNNKKIEYIKNIIENIEKNILNYNKLTLFNILKYSFPILIDAVQQFPNIINIFKHFI